MQELFKTRASQPSLEKMHRADETVLVLVLSLLSARSQSYTQEVPSLQWRWLNSALSSGAEGTHTYFCVCVFCVWVTLLWAKAIAPFWFLLLMIFTLT